MLGKVTHHGKHLVSEGQIFLQIGQTNTFVKQYKASKELTFSKHFQSNTKTG